ncbi:MAG: polysaccharide biosynthesis/export family protein [Syntrophobacter sp.]
MNARTVLLVMLSLTLFCCHRGPYSPTALKVGAPGTEIAAIEQDYRLHVGDKLTVKLFYNPDLNQEVVVRPDGKISLLLVQEINVIGMTPSELTTALTEKYSKHLNEPEVAVIVNSFAGNKVYVGGEVAQPGTKELVGPTTVLNAVAMSGGFKETARTNEVIVLRRGPDQQPFLITLDSEKAMKGIDTKQDIFLQPYDMVLVPRSNIADVNLWVNQYIRGTVGVGSDFMLYYNVVK